MIVLGLLWWLVGLPFRLLFRVLLLAAVVQAALEGVDGDGEADRGRKWWLGRHHPTSHLHRGVRP